MQEFLTAAEQKCRAAIEAHAMLEGVSSLLVGYSGGADSTVLLHLLCRIGAERGISVTAVHIHHMIRGEEADRDLEHCKNVCAQASIPLLFERVDVPALAKKRKTGVEACARQVRYEIFDRLCAQYGFDRIATAHTADDTLETMLFHLARGSGMEGLSGIAPRRDAVIRPLIRCTREEILAYLAAYDLTCVEDSTNLDLAYTRNLIRHKVVPQLRQVNAAAAEHAASAAALLRRDAEYLRTLAHQAQWSPTLPDALLSRKIRAAWDEVKLGGILEEVHVNDAMRLYRTGKRWQMLSLPGKVTMRLTAGDPVFFSASEKHARFFCEIHPGVNDFPGGCLIWAPDAMTEDAVQKDINALKNIYKLFIHLSVDSAKMMGEISVRSRLPGDTLRIGSMTRRVRRLMQNLALSPVEREDWPIVCDSEGPVWVPLCPPADRICGEGASFYLFKN